MPLPERLNTLLRRQVLVHACRSTARVFRERVARADVQVLLCAVCAAGVRTHARLPLPHDEWRQEVTSRNRAILQDVFRAYAAGHSITLPGFLRLAKVRMCCPPPRALRASVRHAPACLHRTSSWRAAW